MKLTGTNVFVLDKMITEHAGTVPARVPSVHATHLQRCVKLGLLDQRTSKGPWHLTPAGIEALVEYRSGVCRGSAITAEQARAELTRTALEAAAWELTHADFKSTRSDGTRVMLYRNDAAGGGTESWPLSSIPEAYLRERVGRFESVAHIVES